MKASKFRFSQPHIIEVGFEENSEFQKTGDSIEMPIQVAPSVHHSESETNASVELRLIIGDNSNQTPFWIKIVMVAKFQWGKDDFSEEDVEKLLNKNAVSLLISYSRPIVAMITSQSRYPTYNLPYVDLTDG